MRESAQLELKRRSIGSALAVMSFGCPGVVADAIDRAVRAGDLGYVSASQIDVLADSTSAWLEREYGWVPPHEGIRPVGDLVAGFRAVLTHFLPTGAPIVVPTPAYMPFLSLPPAMGHPVIEVPMTRDGHRWCYDFDGIRAAFDAGAKLLILCNPHNPIGKVATREELVALEAIVADADGLVFADEIHAPLTFTGSRHRVYAAQSARAAGHTITALSASKAFNIPGVKCGQLVFTNAEHLERWRGVARWYEYNASSLGVAATVAAYSHGRPWLDDVAERLRRTLAAALAVLDGSDVPVRALAPEGTYLLWIDLRDTSFARDRTSRTLAAALLDEAGVVVTDGEECGRAGSGFVRFNAALPERDVVEAMRRLVRAAAA